MLHGRLDLRDARFEECTFDNCSADGGVARRVEAVDCTVWACGLRDVMLEDRLLENLKTSPPGGGKRMPFIVSGVMTRRVTVDLGVWSVVLEDFVASPWPDEIVLIPGLGGRRQSYEADLAGLGRLRAIGAFDE